MVRGGRPLSEGFERTPTLRIFRGSRDGMWWQRHRAGREAHGGAGAELATEAYKGNRNRQGLSWESEGCIVPIEGEGQHNLARGKGPYFVHVLRRVEDLGIAFGLSTPFMIRTLQRKLSRKAKPESGWLETGACLLRKNIGKPCMGKPYARIDEGALGIADCCGPW